MQFPLGIHDNIILLKSQISTMYYANLQLNLPIEDEQSNHVISVDKNK